MRKYFIPILLSALILVSGMFAFIPVQDAATVHTIVMANAIRTDEIVVEGDNAGTLGEDLVITCPVSADGCRIIEVYISENAGGGLSITLAAITANINGDDAVISPDIGTVIAANAFEAIAGISGSTVGGGDTITLEATGATDSTDYSAVIFIETEGNTIATAEFTN